MKNTYSFSFVALLVLGLASSAQAHENGGGSSHHNNGDNTGCTVNLTCDAGGPYVVDGAPGSVVVQLDGTGSFGALTWQWATNFPGAAFNDASLPNATLTIPVTNDCSFNVPVQLTVTRNSVTKTCRGTVKVRDRVKPVLVCPEFAKAFSGGDTSPEATGYATATDNCDQDVRVTYHDKITPGECGANRAVYRIQRTWKAIDNDCNVTKCVQIINIDRNYVFMDVLPGVCPNTYNRNSCANLPIAIASNESLNAAQIQWSSIRLWGLDCSAGPIAPECLELADVATPFFNSPSCNCTNLNGDGKVDLVAKFKRSKINQAFGLANVAPGTAIPVIVTGKLCNGTHFIAQDCIVVQ